jgi:hypothetical protein
VYTLEQDLAMRRAADSIAESHATAAISFSEILNSADLLSESQEIKELRSLLAAAKERAVDLRAQLEAAQMSSASCTASVSQSNLQDGWDVVAKLRAEFLDQFMNELSELIRERRSWWFPLKFVALRALATALGILMVIGAVRVLLG